MVIWRLQKIISMFEKVTGVQNIYLIYVFKTGRSKTIVFIENIDLLKRRKNKEKLYLKKYEEYKEMEGLEC